MANEDDEIISMHLKKLDELKKRVNSKHLPRVDPAWYYAIVWNCTQSAQDNLSNILYQTRIIEDKNIDVTQNIKKILIETITILEIALKSIEDK